MKCDQHEAPAPSAESAFHVWVNPAGTPVPLSGSEVRFAVGIPGGTSTNSWKLWVRGSDVYLACRDNFRDFRLSLHASGIWRLGFTAAAVKQRPDLLLPDGDRVIKKWKPKLDDHRAIIAFQLIVPPESLYLHPSDRKKWPSAVMFVEPPVSGGIAVVSVVVVQGNAVLSSQDARPGCVFALSHLGSDRSVQLVATLEDPIPIWRVLENGLAAAKTSVPGPVPPEGVLVLFGSREGDAPWIAALPTRMFFSDPSALMTDG